MKNLLKEQLDYLQDNPEGYWFKRKLYGWGWTPASWQGWLVLLVWVVIFVGEAVRISTVAISDGEVLLYFAPRALVLIGILLVITYWKGESPCWQWGLPRNKKKEGENIEQSSN